jgi:hypothetical protein
MSHSLVNQNSGFLRILCMLNHVRHYLLLLVCKIGDIFN